MLAAVTAVLSTSQQAASVTPERDSAPIELVIVGETGRMSREATGHVRTTVAVFLNMRCVRDRRCVLTSRMWNIACQKRELVPMIVKDHVPMVSVWIEVSGRIRAMIAWTGVTRWRTVLL